jgi:hypothetical protein
VTEITAGGGSGGDKKNGRDSNGGCTDTRTINNQLKAAVATATKTMMDGDSNNNDYDNDGWWWWRWW